MWIVKKIFFLLKCIEYKEIVATLQNCFYQNMLASQIYISRLIFRSVECLLTINIKEYFLYIFRGFSRDLPEFTFIIAQNITRRVRNLFSIYKRFVTHLKVPSEYLRVIYYKFSGTFKFVNLYVTLVPF